MALDLRQLRYFVAISETGSFNAAARALHIAQSALSRQMQALEQACGGRLMERSVHGVVLTATGELVLARARALMTDAANLLAETNALNDDPAGLVRVAAPSSFGDILYPALAADVTRRLPRVQLELHEALNDAALAALRAGSLEMAVVGAPEQNPHLSYTVLCVEPMLLVGQPGDPRLAVSSFPLEQLPDLPLILPIGGGWLTAARKRLGRRDVLTQATAAIRLQSPGPVKMMLRLGLGYAVLPASAVQAELRAGSLAGTLVRDLAAARVLAVPQERVLSRAAEAVAHAIKTAVSSIIAAGEFGWLPPAGDRHTRAKRRNASGMDAMISRPS